MLIRLPKAFVFCLYIKGGCSDLGCCKMEVDDFEFLFRGTQGDLNPIILLNGVDCKNDHPSYTVLWSVTFIIDFSTSPIKRLSFFFLIHLLKWHSLCDLLWPINAVEITGFQFKLES